MLSDLTGMEIANASLLDESTAAAEAMSMLYELRSRQQKKEGANKFLVSEEVLPQTLALLRTRAIPLGIELHIADCEHFEFTPEFFGVLLQYPGKNGQLLDYASFVEKAKVYEVKVAVAADIMSLVVLTPPGAWGVDVVVGTTQRFGIPLGYGGPHAAFFATKDEYKRSIPGRIIGVSKDTDGNFALRMALQTREQHIKRDKATSNICTAQVLLAVMAAMYAVYHGPEWLKYIARKIHRQTMDFALALEALELKKTNSALFDNLKVEVGDTAKLKEIALDQEINLNYIDGGSISISLNEAQTEADLNQLVDVFARFMGREDKIQVQVEVDGSAIPSSLKREAPFMEHPDRKSTRLNSSHVRIS